MEGSGRKSVKNIPVLENQAGIIVKTERSLYAECFDSPQPWRIFHKPFVESCILKTIASLANRLFLN